MKDASVGATTVTQAVHRFDGATAAAEIARVLRPAGVLALVFDGRRVEDDVHRQVEELLAPDRGDVPARACRGWHAAAERSRLCVLRYSTEAEVPRTCPMR